VRGILARYLENIVVCDLAMFVAQFTFDKVQLSFINIDKPFTRQDILSLIPHRHI